MKAQTPAQVHEIFINAFQSDDIETLLSLYEPHAVLMPQPGETITGHTAIHQALGTFLELKDTFDMKVGRVIAAEGLGILLSPWELIGKDPLGNPVQLSGITSDVVRKQKDGSWLYAIGNPWGVSGLALS